MNERNYIDRTIATVRNHRDADNCWPQWANIFADEIERLRAAISHVINDSPGTPASMKTYLLREMEGSWGAPYERAMLDPVSPEGSKT